MTTKERVAKAVAQLHGDKGFYRGPATAMVAIEEAIETAVAAERDHLLNQVCPTLADIAFADDLSLQGCKNKAKRLYEILRAKELAEEAKERGPT